MRRALRRAFVTGSHAWAAVASGVQPSPPSAPVGANPEGGGRRGAHLVLHLRVEAREDTEVNPWTQRFPSAGSARGRRSGRPNVPCWLSLAGVSGWGGAGAGEADRRSVRWRVHTPE